MRWSAAGTTDAGGKTSSWCASSASGSSATACPCTGRTWRPGGTANKQLIADWREVLPTMSVCLQVPVVMPGELGGPWAERQRAQPWRPPAPQRRRRPPSTRAARRNRSTDTGWTDPHDTHVARSPRSTPRTGRECCGSCGPRAALGDGALLKENRKEFTKQSVCRAPDRVLSHFFVSFALRVL